MQKLNAGDYCKNLMQNFDAKNQYGKTNESYIVDIFYNHNIIFILKLKNFKKIY